MSGIGQCGKTDFHTAKAKERLYARLARRPGCKHIVNQEERPPRGELGSTAKGEVTTRIAKPVFRTKPSLGAGKDGPLNGMEQDWHSRHLAHPLRNHLALVVASPPLPVWMQRDGQEVVVAGHEARPHSTPPHLAPHLAGELGIAVILKAVNETAERLAPAEIEAREGGLERNAPAHTPLNIIALPAFKHCGGQLVEAYTAQAPLGLQEMSTAHSAQTGEKDCPESSGETPYEAKQRERQRHAQADQFDKSSPLEANAPPS